MDVLKLNAFNLINKTQIHILKFRPLTQVKSIKASKENITPPEGLIYKLSDKPLSLELSPCRGFYVSNIFSTIAFGSSIDQVPQCVRKEV
jgi:hypothetical protein